ncbi:hypothetical protein Avbf_07771 [Armadillidium vulgare]|nr:hypothetical protein Avbf_07771 [Armadillidium vulgare]
MFWNEACLKTSSVVLTEKDALQKDSSAMTFNCLDGSDEDKSFVSLDDANFLQTWDYEYEYEEENTGQGWFGWGGGAEEEVVDEEGRKNEKQRKKKKAAVINAL